MLSVSVQGLCKQYGDYQALRQCCFDVKQGEVFGLLGPNGAGKSTLLRTLLGFVMPSAGTAKVCGFDIVTQSLQVRAHTSYLPGDARLYRGMKASAVLQLFGGLHQHGSPKHSLEIARRLDLDVSRRVMFMSTGMRQKLALSVVLGCRAALIVLDEPTANLDPNVRATVLELVREVRSDGRTVILSSHIFSDIDETCDEVAILRNGELVSQQTMAQVGKHHIVTGKAGNSQQAELLKAQVQPLEFVEFFDFERGVAAPKIQMHLAGTPSSWLHWLAEQQLDDLQVERAGIRAVYQQIHAGRFDAVARQAMSADDEAV